MSQLEHSRRLPLSLKQSTKMLTFIKSTTLYFFYAVNCNFYRLPLIQNQIKTWHTMHHSSRWLFTSKCALRTHTIRTLYPFSLSLPLTVLKWNDFAPAIWAVRSGLFAITLHQNESSERWTVTHIRELTHSVRAQVCCCFHCTAAFLISTNKSSFCS